VGGDRGRAHPGRAPRPAGPRRPPPLPRRRAPAARGRPPPPGADGERPPHALPVGHPRQHREAPMDAIRENFPLLLQGIGTTVALTVIGYALALILGTLLAVARVSPIPPLRGAATVYVEIFRNIPLLSLLILISFGLPDVGLLLPYFWCGVLGLTLSSAAFVCENVRSGINTVPIGHAEAARSIGLGFFG